MVQAPAREPTTQRDRKGQDGSRSYPDMAGSRKKRTRGQSEDRTNTPKAGSEERPTHAPEDADSPHPPIDPLVALAVMDAGPPQAPEAAAFWPVVQELVVLLHLETRRHRRAAVDKNALEQIERYLRAASDHSTHGEQRSALESPLLQLAGNRRPDLRRQRERRAQPGPQLLAEYEAVLAVIKPLVGARRTRDSRVARAQATSGKLREAFPQIAHRRRVLRAAAISAPTEAARIVLGARYSLSPARIDELVRDARRSHRQLADLARRFGSLSRGDPDQSSR